MMPPEILGGKFLLPPYSEPDTTGCLTAFYYHEIIRYQCKKQLDYKTWIFRDEIKLPKATIYQNIFKSNIFC